MSEPNANEQVNDTVETAATEQKVQTEENDVRTFTQDEVNEIVQRRIARYGDYDQIKAERDELASSLEATKSTFTDFKADATKQLVEAQAVAIASSLNFIYPEDAPLYVDSAAVMDEDGNVSKEKIAEQLTRVAEERNALVRSNNSKTSGADIGLGTTGTPKPKSNGQLFADALKSAF